MLVVVPPENRLEERAGGTEDDFVSRHLVCIAGQGDVTKLGLFSDCLDGRAEVALKVIPLQTKLLRHRHCNHLPATTYNSINSS